MSYVTRRNTYQATPANPTGTNSTFLVYMGLGASFTPKTSGKMFVMICGNVQNSIGADGAKMLPYYGTGATPSNGVAVSGTTIGTLVELSQNFANANQSCPFSCTGVVTGLTVGKTYWIDLGLAALTGGVASVKNISISIFET